MNRVLLLLLRILRSLPQGLLGMLRKLEMLTMTVKKQARCFRDGLVIKIRSAHGRSEAAKTREVRAARRYNISVDPQKSNKAAEAEKYLVEVPSYEQESETLALFLNLAMKDIYDNPSSLEAYTEAMSAEDDELLAGVEVDW